MKYEQAIHELKRDCWYRTAECDCLRTCKEDDDCHIKTAIESVEKQIPKKPKEDGWLYCDICGLDILMQTDVNGHRYRFCPACGQAIDWRDDE